MSVPSSCPLLFMIFCQNFVLPLGLKGHFSIFIALFKWFLKFLKFRIWYDKSFHITCPFIIWIFKFFPSQKRCYRNIAILVVLGIIIVLHAPPCPDCLIISQIVIRGYACLSMISSRVDTVIIKTICEGLSCTCLTCIKSNMFGYH